jgi:hypothetical protein
MMFPYILKGKFPSTTIELYKTWNGTWNGPWKDAFYKIFHLPPVISSFQLSPPQHVLIVTPISGGVTSSPLKLRSSSLFKPQPISLKVKKSPI